MLLNDVVREYEIGRRFGDGDIRHRDKIGYRVGAHAFLNGHGFSMAATDYSTDCSMCIYYCVSYS